MTGSIWTAALALFVALLVLNRIHPRWAAVGLTASALTMSATGAHWGVEQGLASCPVEPTADELHAANVQAAINRAFDNVKERMR